MKKIQMMLMMVLMIIGTNLVGCEKEEDVDVYASIYPVYFLLDEITQGSINIKQVYPAGTDVHDYDPSSMSELINMSKADLMFYIGSGLEAFIENAAANVFKDKNIELVELGDYVDLIEVNSAEIISDTHSHTVDTHLWLDPNRMIELAKVMKEKLILEYPELEEEFKKNTDKLISELKELNQEYESRLSNPKLQKIIVVDHDAYGYLEERYGIKRIKTRVDNEVCDVVNSDFTNNIELIKSYNIKYIVVTKGESVCPIITKYQDVLKLQLVELNHIATLTKQEQKEKKNYITLMKENLEILINIFPTVD